PAGDAHVILCRLPHGYGAGLNRYADDSASLGLCGVSGGPGDFAFTWPGDVAHACIWCQLPVFAGHVGRFGGHSTGPLKTLAIVQKNDDYARFSGLPLCLSSLSMFFARSALKTLNTSNPPTTCNTLMRWQRQIAYSFPSTGKSTRWYSALAAVFSQALLPT